MKRPHMRPIYARDFQRSNATPPSHALLEGLAIPLLRNRLISLPRRRQ